MCTEGTRSIGNLKVNLVTHSSMLMDSSAIHSVINPSTLIITPSTSNITILGNLWADITANGRSEILDSSKFFASRSGSCMPYKGCQIFVKVI